MQEKINEIRNLTNLEIYHFQFSKTAKIPFKVHSFIEIMNLRMLDFCESTNLLLETNHVIPALSTLRVIFENVAVSNRISLAIKNTIKSGQLPENFDELISKINFGTRYNDEYPAINILTQIEKLNKEYPITENFYEALSEFVHPNWDGVQGSYSELVENKKKTELRKIITNDHDLMNWINACFDLCLVLHLEIHKEILEKLPIFATICETEIIKKTLTNKPIT
jgi:hypothetical protein